MPRRALDTPAPVQAKPAGSAPSLDLTAALDSAFDFTQSPAPVQARGDVGPDAAEVQARAAEGVAGSGTTLPHLDQIQASFGPGHDLSGVRAHVGGDAATAASAIGATAYATGSNVAFASSPDLHLAAHEATHVVQQQAGVHLAGGVGQAGDAYEQHADAVADRVVAGRSASDLLAPAASNAVTGGHVQRFSSLEHKGAIDEGGGNISFTKAGCSLTQGDLGMLRGDFFPESELLALWGMPSPMPGDIPHTQDEIIYAIHRATSGRDERFREGGEWHGISFSPAVKKAVDDRYLALAAVNDDHFANPQKAGFGRAGFPPGSAPATYREAHERAISSAYEAGVADGDISDALITEAMGQHFLTDSFSAGHITTPRAGIAKQWGDLYPRFGEQFKEKLIADLAVRLSEQASLLSSLVPAGELKTGVRKIIEEKLAGKPLSTLGHIFSLLAHDYDNAQGVSVVNDLGWRWMAYGDGKLDATADDGMSSGRRHRDVVVEAVAAATNEVRDAYDLGRAQRQAPLRGYQVYDQMQQRVRAPARPSGKFAAEQYLPRPDPDSGQGDLHWKAAGLSAIWTTHIRGPATPDYGALFQESAQKGDIADMLAGIIKELPEEINPFREIGGLKEDAVNVLPAVRYGHGHIFPRKAFQTAVIDRLSTSSTALAFLLELVSL